MVKKCCCRGPRGMKGQTGKKRTEMYIYKRL